MTKVINYLKKKEAQPKKKRKVRKSASNYWQSAWEEVYFDIRLAIFFISILLLFVNAVKH